MSDRATSEQDLDQLERLVLHSARRAVAPGTPDPVRMRAAIEARIAAVAVTGLPAIDVPPVPDPNVIPVPTGAELTTSVVNQSALTQPASSVSLTPWVSLAPIKVIGVAVAVAGSVWVGPRVVSELRSESSAVELPRTAEPPTPETGAAPGPTERDTSDSEQPPATNVETPDSPISSDASSAARTAAVPARKTSVSRELAGEKTTSAEAEPASRSATIGAVHHSLTRELEQLHAAQRALQDGDPSRALRLIDTLERGASEASLLLERRIIKVLALCGLGRQAEAQALVPEDSPAANVYAARLKNSCVRGPTPTR